MNSLVVLPKQSPHAGRISRLRHLLAGWKRIRTAGWLLTALILLASRSSFGAAASFGQPHELSEDYAVGATFEHVRLLGALKLKTKDADGLLVNELSGLAWDEDEARLYAVSDNGFILHIAPVFDKGNLVGAEILARYPLLGEHGEPQDDDHLDSEGMTVRNAANGIRGDTELVVAYEEPPRIAGYDSTGRWLYDVKLPIGMTTAAGFSDPKKQLADVVEHPVLGLLAVPERPLKTVEDGFFAIHDLSGHAWVFPPLHKRHSALLGLTLDASGDVIVLERVFASIFKPIRFALRRVRVTSAPLGGKVAVEPIVEFSTADGWNLDNFEGVARHKDDRYFVVSDDNDNKLQKSLLLYLQVLQR